MSKASSGPSEQAKAPQTAGLRSIGAMPGTQIGTALVVVAAAALEVLPVAAWLLVLSAANHALNAVPLPLWWLFMLVLIAWIIATPLRRSAEGVRRSTRGDLRLKLLVVVGWGVTLAISLLLSPSAYAGIGLNRLLPIVASDITLGSDRLASVFGLGVLATYLWWRGLFLGRLPLYHERLYARFVVGLAAIILAIATSAAVPGNPRAELLPLLAVMLPFQIFVGLTGIALAHLRDTANDYRQRRLRDGADRGAAPSVGRSWVVTTLGISAAVVVAGLVLALLVSYDTLQALIASLQPVWDGLGTVIGWLVEAFAFLLFLLLDPLIGLIRQFLSSHTAHPQPTSPNPGNRPPASQHPGNGLPTEWLVAGRWVLVVLLFALVAVILVRVLRRFAEWRRGQGFEEERETLDVGEVLGGQLRDLLRRFQRQVTSEHQPGEALTPGSVRWLYRDVLVSAAAAGLSRRPDETPDEYAARLTAQIAQRNTSGLALDGVANVGPDVGLAVETLTTAYDPARYANESALEREHAPPGVIAAQQSLLAWLRARIYAATQGQRRSSRGLFARRQRHEPT